MLRSKDIVKILRESSLILKHSIEMDILQSLERENRVYLADEFQEFQRDLLEACSKVKLLLLPYSMNEEGIRQLISSDNLVLGFKRNATEVIPVLVQGQRKDFIYHYIGSNSENNDLPWMSNEKGEVMVFVIFPYKNVVSEEGFNPNGPKPGPVKRFLHLLATEKREIIYIMFYGIIVGLISLILPLGIQTTVEFISGGVFFSSVYLLIGLVILGVVLTGIFQIIQISLVEHLQRRIFAKAAFEFAFRIPRLKIQSISQSYAPELVNRFFDIVTIQKGLPKFLIDLSASAIQIFFGLLLLSLYHPFFVFFSLILVAVLVVIFYITGPRGLESSLNESKYKYRVVYWFEEMARTLQSFKLAGNTPLPFRRTDYNVNNYLKYRKTHFNILITQFSFIIFFKAVVTGTVLIVGTSLVVNREINLGQFVAAEIVIILILNAVEKVIMYMDVVYDLLTAVDKVGTITDLPLDKMGGADLPVSSSEGYAIEVKDLKFRYSADSPFVLTDINLSINPGERVCISGNEGAGKSTLANIIAGLETGYQGIVTINKFSLHDLDLTHLRNSIAKNISPEDIFDGTIMENITLGKDDKNYHDAVYALSKAGLQDKVNSMPEGLNTRVISGGKGFSTTTVHRLILARCMAKNPQLVILNDFFTGLTKTDKIDLINRVIDRSNKWTVIAVSNDPIIMSACDHIVVLKEGRMIAEGDFASIMTNDQTTNVFE